MKTVSKCIAALPGNSAPPASEKAPDSKPAQAQSSSPAVKGPSALDIPLPIRIDKEWSRKLWAADKAIKEMIAAGLRLGKTIPDLQQVCPPTLRFVERPKDFELVGEPEGYEGRMSIEEWALPGNAVRCQYRLFHTKSGKDLYFMQNSFRGINKDRQARIIPTTFLVTVAGTDAQWCDVPCRASESTEEKIEDDAPDTFLGFLDFGSDFPVILTLSGPGGSGDFIDLNTLTFDAETRKWKQEGVYESSEVYFLKYYESEGVLRHYEASQEGLGTKLWSLNLKKYLPDVAARKGELSGLEVIRPMSGGGMKEKEFREQLKKDFPPELRSGK